MQLRFTQRKNEFVYIFLSCRHTHTHSLLHTRAHNESTFARLNVREKDDLPLSLCLNEPWRPAFLPAFSSQRLKLARLTGADVPARSQADLGPDWKYHYHINHGCTRMDHSFTTYIINMAVIVCVREMSC